MLGLFRFYPIFSALLQSFQQIDFREEVTLKFVGLLNYIDLIGDPVFLKSVQATIYLVVITLPIQIGLALLLALLLSGESRRVRILRTVHLIPLGVSLPIACVMWKIMLQPSGLVNGLLVFFRIPQQPLLTSTQQAIWCIVVIASWKGIAFWTLFLLAGLKEIPMQLYEAAKIDGANVWQIFRKITLPLLARVLLFVVVADTTACFMLFVPMFLITRGGPQLSTNVLMFEAYRSAFVYWDMGRAASIVSLLLGALFLVIILEFWVFRPRH